MHEILAQAFIMNKLSTEWMQIMIIFFMSVAFGLLIHVRRLKKCIENYVNIEKELRYCSEYDMLSGLKNRNAFLRQEREMQDRIVTVLICDIDGLKIINDTLGHCAGDQLIRNTANILKKVTPADSQIFRMGGDEFLVLLPGDISAKDEGEIYEGLKEQIAIYNQGSPNLQLSLSAGIATNSINGGQLSDVIREADCVMYEQKRICQEQVRKRLKQALKYNKKMD